jgi:hypothetical protein
MLNLGIAGGAAVLVFIVITALLGWVPAVVPAIAVFGLLTWFLTQRVSKAVEPQMIAAVELLKERKVPEAKAALAAIKRDWGRWQLFLDGQIDAQLGMIAYLQMQWDEALPLLESGRWRNWMALTCIGCIQWRKDKKDEAYASFSSAVDASSAEMAPYMVWATLLERDNKRDTAMQVCDRGVRANPGAAFLVELRDLIANKKKVDTKKFPESWYQFFPDDYLAQYQQQAVMRGKRNPEDDLPPLPGQAQPEPAKMNRAQRRAAERNK